jgi:dTDP-4-amino-4,6-dideoxygalactose transaminase
VPYEPECAKAIYHLYVIRVEEREAFMRSLAEAGIGAGIHYPVPLHLQQAYAHLGYRAGDFPIAEKVAPEIVSLPMFPQLKGEQQARVVASVSDFMLTAPLATAQPVASH